MLNLPHLIGQCFEPAAADERGVSAAGSFGGQSSVFAVGLLSRDGSRLSQVAVLSCSEVSKREAWASVFLSLAESEARALGAVELGLCEDSLGEEFLSARGYTLGDDGQWWYLPLV